MDTLSHGAWTYILMRNHRHFWPAVVGALVSDIPVILTALIIFCKGLVDKSQSIMQQVNSIYIYCTLDSIMHSFIIWTPLLGLSLVFHHSVSIWFALGGHFHIGIDILTHLKYPSAYLWPFKESRFIGIVDYTTIWFTLINGMLILGCLVWLKHYRKI